MATFYAARSEIITPLPWLTFALPFSVVGARRSIAHYGLEAAFRTAPQHKHLFRGCLNVSCRHRRTAASHLQRMHTFRPYCQNVHAAASVNVGSLLPFAAPSTKVGSGPEGAMLRIFSARVVRRAKPPLVRYSIIFDFHTSLCAITIFELQISGRNQPNA